ncbi:MAG: RNA recognition motif domain-containing protein [Thermosynechococcaceae cyanobacterium]
MSIFVENLPYATHKEDLKKLFTPYGTVMAVMIINTPADSETEEEPRGFAYVNMSSDAEEENAIAELESVEWMGQTLKVNKVRTLDNFEAQNR